MNGMGRVLFNSHLQIGISYVLCGVQQSATSHGLGPSVRVGVPHGAVTLDWFASLRAYHPQTRLTVRTAL